MDPEALALLALLLCCTSSVAYNVFSECNPHNKSHQLRDFTLCTFNTIPPVALVQVGNVYSNYLAGNAYFAGRASISALKVKRNQFPWIVPGTVNHQFGYVVFGNFSVIQNGTYKLCARSDDGAFVYWNEELILSNDGLHFANIRVCSTKYLSSGAHSIYILGFEAIIDSQLEVTYSGPDTDDVRTVIGAAPYYEKCNPRSGRTSPGFTLCTFKSEPTTFWNGECVPTIGLAHPSWTGPCARAINTTDDNFDYAYGGFVVPLIGTANQIWSDIRYVGQTSVNITDFGPRDAPGTFTALVPGTPDCRIGFDGAIGADGSNCPFQMWSVFGNVSIRIAGAYSFCTLSGDGSRLYVDGTQVVDNDFLQLSTERCGTIQLGTGDHVVYSEGWSWDTTASLTATYQGPDNQKIPLGTKCTLCELGKYLSGCSSISMGTCLPCTVCPSGQYNSGCVGISSGSCQTCSTCPPQSIMSGCGGINSGNCVSLCKVCPSGQYQVGCNRTYNGSCVLCPSCLPGQYSFGCGGNFSGQCILCEPGKFRAGQGPLNSLECQNCDSGAANGANCSGCMNMSTQCSLCHAGTFQTGLGGINCTLCNAGTYLTGTGMFSDTQCSPCSPGSYQTGTGLADSTRCLLCPAGRYQTGLGMLHLNNCSLCGVGTYQSGLGSGNCSKCVNGKYQTGFGMIEPSNCSICFAGTYQTGLGSVNCTMCPVGTYQSGSGMFDLANCSLCGTGTYQTSFGALNVGNCSLCASGRYQTGLGMVNENNCSMCISGTFQSASGSTNCAKCAAGTYQTGSGMSTQGDCVGCFAGSYQTGTGMQSIKNCSLCMVGKFQTGFGMQDARNCTNCGVGLYQTGSGSLNCTACPAGTFQTGLGMFSPINCSLCYAGTYQSGYGMIDTKNCSVCMAGKYQSGLGMSELSQCSLCTAGTYQTGLGYSNCTLCPAGTYLTNFGMIDSINCTLCSAGTYGTGFGMLSKFNCTLCAAGKFQTGLGIFDTKNCVFCGHGKYQTGVGTFDCLMCMRGTYQTGLGMQDAENCSKCTAGSFQTGLGISNASDCSLCPAGKYQTGEGIALAVSCIFCDPGLYALGMGNRNCTFCGAGKYQTGVGMVNAANCSLCNEGSFQTGLGMLNRDSCLPCSPGTYQTGLGMLGQNNCSLCGAGLVQSGAGSINCSLCVPGTYQTGMGMSSYANCSLCDKGKYQTGYGISNETECLLCFVGKYQTGIGITDSVLCRNCGPGYFQTGVGMPSQQNCSLCIFGTFQTGSGMYNSSSCGFCSPGTFQTGFGAVNCTHCSAGTFQTGFGIYNESHCSLCKPGTYQTGTGMINTSDCFLCSGGKYQTGFGLADPKYCSYCKAGSYQTGSGMVSQDSCVLCGAGMYQTGNGMSSSSYCSLCFAGTYQSGVGIVNCTLCTAGQYQTGFGMSNCSLCNVGKYQTGTGMMNQESCVLCTAGTYQSSDGMSDESSCKVCDAGKYYSGLGNPSAENCTTGLSPTLKLQAQATTVVVSTVVAMVVSTSVGGAIASAVGGSVASSGGSGGASIFQLIQATQFMNVFGKLIDQRSAKANGARRSEQVSNVSESGSDENQESAAFEVDGAGDASEFSDQFAWANGRFDDIFSLRPDTCAGVLLQPFFGIVGTAVAVIGASFMLRALVNLIMTYTSSKSEDEEISSSGLGFGAFEYAVIKTAHLGLCQASGYAISTAMYSPTCGSSAQLVWALALCWLLSFPIGFTVYLGYKMAKSKSSKGIKFARKKHAGSWSAYFKNIYRAEGSHDRFCRPHIIHYSLKIFFGFSGALLLFLAISFVSDPSNDLVRTILLFVFGFVLLIIAGTLSKRPGRKVVVFLTNILAYHLKKQIVIVEGDAVVERNLDFSEEQNIVFKSYRAFLAIFVSCMAWIQAKIEVAVDPTLLWALRHRGKWVRKDELKIFYSELNDRAIYFAVFLMIKNVIIGITLADNLVDSLRKAWVIALLYCFELLIHLFFSPDVDAINGLKMAAQVGLQTVIMITAALVTSGRVKSAYGEQICIQVSLVQIFLAIPEQIWSVVSMTILKKNGPPREPDFKTTVDEITVAKEKASITFGQLLQACVVVQKGIRSMTPALKSGDPAGIITELIIRKNMLVSLEKLNGRVLSILFDDIFHCISVRQALELEMKIHPEISPSVIKILGNKWNTSVDFRDGVSHLFEIKEILEAPGNLEVLQSPEPHQHGEAAFVSGLHFGIQPDEQQQPCNITGKTQVDQFQNLQDMPTTWVGYDMTSLNCGPQLVNCFYSHADHAGNFQHRDYAMSLLSNDLHCSAPQQTPFSISAVSTPELVFYQHTPADFAFMPFWQGTVTGQDVETVGQADQLSSDGCILPSHHTKSFQRASSGPSKGVAASCSEAEKKSSSSAMANETGWPLEDTKTAVSCNDLPACLPGSFTTGTMPVQFPQEHWSAAGEKSAAPSSGAAADVALKTDGINAEAPGVKSAGDDADEGLFKMFIERVIGACDSDTMEGLNEKLTSMLPDELTGLIEEVPAGLAAANSIMALEMEENEEEECGTEGSGADKRNNHGNGELEKGVSAASGEATTEQKKKKVPFKKAVPAVQLICGLPWDWILFNGSIILALSALFVLTALASTTCTCLPKNIVDDMNATLP